MPHNSRLLYSSDLYSDIESDYDDDDYHDNDICDYVEQFEEQFQYIVCKSNNYYIGSYFVIDDETIMDGLIAIAGSMLLFGKKINIKTFFNYTHYEISTYIYYSAGIIYDKKPTIEIMQMILHSDGVTYTAIIKTIWIKLIQRTWKKIVEQRKNYHIHFKKNILSILQVFQTTHQIKPYPRLKGMLNPLLGQRQTTN